MRVAPLPSDEPARLAALHEYDLLDTPPEELFDAFARIAALICDTPISAVSLIDETRQFWKARIGLEPRETSRDVAFCAHAILDEGLFEVSDAAADERFADNPLVTTDPPNIRFYAGVPLRNPEGHALGTLCVIDERPRELTTDQRAALTALGDALMEQFEARRTMLRLFDSAATEMYHIDVTDGRVVFASAAARHNLGYDEREIREVTVPTLLPRVARAGVLQQRVAQLRNAPDRRMHLKSVARRKDGSLYPVELRIELMTARGRDLALVVATDLTESERAQERINLLSAAVETASDAVSICRPAPDGTLTVVYANEAYLRMKNAAADGVIGHPDSHFFGERTDGPVIERMRREIASGVPSRGQYVTYRADGQPYYVETTAKPVLDHEGRITHVVEVHRDVSETVLRGAQLSLQNERLTALTSIARGLFASLDARTFVPRLLQGVHALVDGDARLFVAVPDGGFRAATQLDGEPDGDVGDALVAAAATADFTQTSADDRRVAVRASGSGSADEAQYVLEVSRRDPFAPQDVFAIGLLGQFVAVALRNVELYRELGERTEAVTELNGVKNDLIAMLAHDFKGPLTTIVGFADALSEEDGLGAEHKSFLQMISSSAMRLASLANETLAFSRLEQKDIALALDDCDLAGLVREVASVLGVTRAIEIRVAGPVPAARVDAARLRQVLENLIGNAIKYSPGGEPVEVTVRAAGEAIEIAVRDRGIGIPQAEVQRLFGRFARASNARAAGIRGTGFGLYYSRLIAEAHGGAIRVDSEQGRGSTFTLVVPVRPPRRGGRRRFLLLDADGEGRSYIARALRDDGYAVAVATSCEEFGRLIEEGRFDVGLVDADSLDVDEVRLLRRADGLPLVRIGGESSASGWSAATGKPFLLKDLYGAVDAALKPRIGGAPSDRANARGSS